MFPYTLKVHRADAGWTECTIEWGGTRERSSKSTDLLGKIMHSVRTLDIPVNGRVVQAATRADVREAFNKACKGTANAKRLAWKRAFGAAIASCSIGAAEHNGEDYLYS